MVPRKRGLQHGENILEITKIVWKLYKSIPCTLFNLQYFISYVKASRNCGFSRILSIWSCVYIAWNETKHYLPKNEGSFIILQLRALSVKRGIIKLPCQDNATNKRLCDFWLEIVRFLLIKIVPGKERKSSLSVMWLSIKELKKYLYI